MEGIKNKNSRVEKQTGPCCFVAILDKMLQITFDDSAFGVAHKHDDFVSLFGGRQLGFDAFEGVAVVHVGEVEVTIYLLYVANGFVGEVATAQPDRVDSGIGYGVAAGFDVGGDVFVDVRATLYHHMSPDVGELVYEASAADDGVIVDDDFAGYLCRIGDNDVVADDTVVGDVRIGHDQAVAAYDGFTFGSGAAVHGDAFAQRGVVAYLRRGVFSLKFHVLGNGRDDSPREYLAVFTNAGSFENGHV